MTHTPVSRHSVVKSFLKKHSHFHASPLSQDFLIKDNESTPAQDSAFVDFTLIQYLQEKKKSLALFTRKVSTETILFWTCKMYKDWDIF